MHVFSRLGRVELDELLPERFIQSLCATTVETSGGIFAYKIAMLPRRGTDA